MLNRDSKRPTAWAWRLSLGLLLGIGVLALLDVMPAWAADASGGDTSDARPLVGLLLVLALVVLAGIDFAISLIRRRGYRSR